MSALAVPCSFFVLSGFSSIAAAELGVDDTRNTSLKYIAALVVASGAYVCGAVGPVPPDGVALDRAREDARVLLADDFRRLNTGRTTLLELAERVADMAAASSNSPAMRRVLHEGAFNMYREAANLKRAAERRVPFWINLGTDAESRSR